MEMTMPHSRRNVLMMRKLAMCAVVALVPGVAFAATATTPVPANSATHAVTSDVKTDSSVKADALAKPDKAVTHTVKHKTKGAKAKAGATTDGKAESSKL
jgi:hypothetical protein